MNTSSSLKLCAFPIKITASARFTRSNYLAAKYVQQRDGQKGHSILDFKVDFIH